jgi:hypothetical protein
MSTAQTRTRAAAGPGSETRMAARTQGARQRARTDQRASGQRGATEKTRCAMFSAKTDELPSTQMAARAGYEGRPSARRRPIATGRVEVQR